MRRTLLVTLALLLLMPSTALAWICAPVGQTLARAPFLAAGRVTGIPSTGQVELAVWAWLKGSGPRNVTVYFGGFPREEKAGPPQTTPEELAYFGIEVPAPGELVLMSFYRANDYLVFGACHPFIHIRPVTLVALAVGLAVLVLVILRRIRKRR